MYRIGFFILSLILVAFHQRKRIFLVSFPDSVLQNPRAFNLTGIGISIYILAPMLGYSLVSEFGENSSLLHPLGILIGVIIIGYALIEEINYTQVESQKALAEEKEKYQMLVEKMEEGVLLEDAEGVISFVNPKLTKMLGYTEDELLGKHWSYIAAVEDLDKFKAESAKRPFGISSTYEARTLAKDGQRIPVIITASPIFAKNGDLTGVLSVYVDITERKQAEEALQQVKLEEERYHAMLSHFVNNDLQKIISNLELLVFIYESSQALDNEAVKCIIEIASLSSRTIDTVSKIFEVLQSPFIQSKKSFNLLDIIDKAISKLFSKDVCIHYKIINNLP